MAGCEGGWFYEDKCDDKYTCDTTKCGSKTQEWKETYHRCKKTVDNVNYYNCFWVKSDYEGCCS